MHFIPQHYGVQDAGMVLMPHIHQLAENPAFYVLCLPNPSGGHGLLMLAPCTLCTCTAGGGRAAPQVFVQVQAKGSHLQAGQQTLGV